MPKQLYIPLPCAQARAALLARHLGIHVGVDSALTQADTDKLVTRTQGYSGSDMRALIQEACQVSSQPTDCMLDSHMDHFVTSAKCNK